MQLIAKQKRLEVWVRFDPRSNQYEIFADRDGLDFIGTTESLPEAKRIAKLWLNEYSD